MIRTADGNISHDFAVRRVHRVVDGDTFDLEIDLGFYQFAVYRFRLNGVDTPEIYGSNASDRGHEAKEFVEEWLAQHLDHLRLKSSKTGSFGRWLADVYDAADGSTLAGALLDAGLAEEYRR